jgi:hypothetical protein
MEWQPIETAPKDDDACILVTYCLHDDVWAYEIVSYAYEDARGHWWQNIEVEAIQPTHWMPLPEPPA